MNDNPLDAARRRIDDIDRSLQALVTERAELAREIARLKEDSGEDGCYLRPEREAEILRQVMARNQGPLEDEQITRIFREIMSACLALEQPMRIAFLGPAGTFTQAAAFKHFGHAVTTVPQSDVPAVFRDVSSGAAHYGVVPVENSSEGVVTHTLDMFFASPLKIVGEVELRIHHHLLSISEDTGAVTRLYAHQQALAQCRGWLDEHLPQVERVAVTSNGLAAQRAVEERQAAAIAGSAAAELYGLKVLAANIEDESENTTRFLVVGRNGVPVSGYDKTSLLVSARNRPGALARLLAPLSEYGLSMTRIESRPSRQAMWEYVFFIDIEGHADDPNVAQALEALDAEASTLKLLGSYPRAVV